MKGYNYTIILLIFLVLSSFKVQSQSKAHVSRVKIHATKEELLKIKQVGIEFDHGFYDHLNLTYINETEYSNVEKIKSLGFKVDILVYDVFAYTDSLNTVEDPYKYEEQPVRRNKDILNMEILSTPISKSYDNYITTPTNFKFGSMGGFYNLTELELEIDDMVAKYPGLVTKNSIGNTLTGKPIWVVKISDNASIDESESEILYTGMHHSREGMSMMNLIYFMWYILENHSSNPSIKEIIDSRELFFIPVVNIDGFNYNTTKLNWDAGKRMRRKNMAETTSSDIGVDGSGGDGVDINRNYGTYWGFNYSGNNSASSGTGSSEAYRGQSAFSEPETQRMRDFINNRNFKIAINYHCYGNWWIRPQGPDNTLYTNVNIPSASVNVYNSIAALFTNYNCYVYGTPEQTVYPVNGYSDDWLFSDPSHNPIYSFSPEIGNASDGFWCPQSKIIPYAKELVYSNLQSAYSVGSYADLQDKSDLSIKSLNGSFDFSVLRRGLTDDEITVELIPLSNIQSVGSRITIPSIPNFGGVVDHTITYALPSTLESGSIIRYVWQLKTGGITINDTIIKIYNPTLLFADNMDNIANYSENWEESPKNNPWAYATGVGILGTNALTESPSGNYVDRADYIIRLKSSLNLASSTHAYLSYMIKYTSENCKDRLQLEISTTGVNGTYTPIASENTITENRGNLGGIPAYTGSTNGWKREIINLSNYIGNNNIGLRFRFQSDDVNSEAYVRDGYYIDNLMVVKTNATILPISFNDIYVQRLDDNIIINWKATLDENFLNYDVEKSNNGIHFESISKIVDTNIFQYIDRSPNQGQNYYRLKVVQKDGGVKYSKVVAIVFETSKRIAIYPNPVKDILNIEINSEEYNSATIIITTLDGREVQKKVIQMMPGVKIYKVDISTITSQLFFIKVVNEKGVLLKALKVLKK